MRRYNENVPERSRIVSDAHAHLSNGLNYPDKEELRMVKEAELNLTDLIAAQIQYSKKNILHMSREEYSGFLARVFQLFEEGDSQGDTVLTEKMSLILENILKQENIKAGDYAGEYNMYSKVVSNLTDRRTNNGDLFQIYFLRLLNPSIREMIWRAALVDLQAAADYIENVRRRVVDLQPKNRVEVFTTAQEVMKEKFPEIEEVQDKEILIRVTNVLIYYAQIKKVPLTDLHYDLIMPLAFVFRSDNSEEQLWGYYKSLLELYNYFNGKNVSQANILLYETQLEDHIILLLDTLKYINFGLGEFLKKIIYMTERDDGSVRSGLENKNIRITRARMKLGGFVRTFLEKMSAGVCDLGLTCFLWDTIFLKELTSQQSLQIELYLALALCLISLKEELEFCKEMEELMMILSQRMCSVQGYDFYLLYCDSYKTKDIYEFERGLDISQIKMEMRARNLPPLLGRSSPDSVAGAPMGHEEGKVHEFSDPFMKGLLQNVGEALVKRMVENSAMVPQVDVEQIEEDLFCGYDM